jgi:hypothetical protein
VLHEFGHAMGLQHEHQTPNGGCESEFLWQDEAQYQPTRDVYQQFVPDRNGKRPGLYTVLGGPPNNWDRSIVDHNIRQFPDSRAFYATPFDSQSIMKYEFPAWQFVRGEASHCFSRRNETLSSGDRTGIAAAYPRELALIRQSNVLQLGALAAVKTAAGEVLKDDVKGIDARILELRGVR